MNDRPMMGWSQIVDGGVWHQVETRETAYADTLIVRTACGATRDPALMPKAMKGRPMYWPANRVLDYRAVPPRQCRRMACRREVEP